MKKILFFLFIVASMQLQAQKKQDMAIPQLQQVIDSLVSRLGTAKADTAKLILLHEIAYSYRLTRPDEGIKYGQQELKLAEQLHNEAGIGNAYFDLGTNYIQKSDFKNALYYSEAALKTYKALQMQLQIAIVSTDIGVIYYKRSYFPQALDWYFKALYIAESNSFKEQVASCQEGIGNVFKAQGNYPRALEYLNKGLNEYKKSGNRVRIMHILASIGSVHFGQDNYQSALECYTKALAIAEEINDKKSIAENEVCIGNVFSEKGEHAKALECQFKALDIFIQTDTKSGLVDVYGNIGITYLFIANDTASIIHIKGLIPDSRAENLKLAINYLHKAIDIEKEIGELNTLQQLYENISEAYSLSGKYKEAYDYSKQYNIVKEEIFSKENNAKMANIVKAHEEENQKKIDRINARKKRNERIFFAAGIGLLLVVAIVIGRSYRTQKKLNITITKLVNEQEQIIQERTRELAISNEKLIESNVKLANYNKKLIELMQFNAHNLREPLTRIMGAMVIQEYISQEEFYGEIWPQMKKATNDLDVIIKEVITRADEALENQG